MMDEELDYKMKEKTEKIEELSRIVLRQQEEA